MSTIPVQIDSTEARRVLRFMVVGASGTLLDFSILTLLKWLGLPTLPANTISYLSGTINNFYWNRRWTFNAVRGQAWRKQFFQFFCVALVGLLLNNALTLLLEVPFTGWIGYYGFLPAKLIATSVVLLWNYVANRLWTFRKQIEANKS
jgi:putative flippase GtrA